MPWQVFIGISVVLFSISVLLQRVLLRESNSQPVAYAIVFQMLIGILIGIVAVLTGQWQLPDFGPIILNMIFMTGIYAAGNVFIFMALKQTEASKFTILFSSKGLFTILASTLLLHEGLTPLQLVGALLIFAGVVSVNVQTQQKMRLSRGDLLALAAGLAFGLANTNDRVLLMHMNVYVYSSIGFMLPAFLLAVIYPRELRHVRMFLEPKPFSRMVFLCVFYAISSATFFLALQQGSNSSQVASISLTSMILTVLLAIIFLKERTDLARKLLGAGLSFAGLLLLG